MTIDPSKFQALTEAYELLVSTNARLEEIAERIEREFNDEDSKFFQNPIHDYDLDMYNKISTAANVFTRFIVGKMNTNDNFKINREDIENYVKENGFNHLNIINFIQHRYADEDAESLKQILEICRGTLPYGGWGSNESRRAYKPDHIKTKSDNTIELSASWHELNAMHQVDALIKLINITLGGIEPSKVTGKPDLQVGETYRSTYVQSMRHYKNHTIRIKFYNQSYAERVKAALVDTDGGD